MIETDLNKKWLSEVGQDAFAYDFCGQRNTGTFLDLGCWEPYVSSNSYSLERMGWTGILCDCDPMYAAMCREYRTSPVILAQAQDVDWKSVCEQHGIGSVIDFASIDVEDAEMKVLHSLANAGLSFRVITIEHNRYSHGDEPRDAQREFLLAQGYTLAVPDKKNSTGLEFEDWWTK